MLGLQLIRQGRSIAFIVIMTLAAFTIIRVIIRIVAFSIFPDAFRVAFLAGSATPAEAAPTTASATAAAASSTVGGPKRLRQDVTAAAERLQTEGLKLSLRR